MATINDLTFTLSSDKTYYSVEAKSTSISGALTIPATYNGLPVKAISSSAFYGCSRLTSITIPDGVTSIGYVAFQNCSNLTSIIIPNSVTSIGEDAFYNCSGLTSVTIPDGVTRIGYCTFYGCSSLTSITIPDGVISIGFDAFRGCSSLTSITIPDSVVIIGVNAFDGCSSLTSITIPDGVNSIGSKAFYNCSGLTYFKFEGNYITAETQVLNGTNNLTEIHVNSDATGWGDTWAEKTIVIDDSRLVYTLSDDGTYYSVKAKDTTISDSVVIASMYDGGIPVKVIENNAFAGCSLITSVTIPDSITEIGEYAFRECSGLTSITLSNSLTSIDIGAFFKCSSITAITIPASVTSIGMGAFVDCDELVYFKFKGNCIEEPLGGMVFGKPEPKKLTSLHIDDNTTGWGTKWCYVPIVKDDSRLVYTLSDDGTYYSVKAKDTTISDSVVIASMYDGGIPVKVIENNAFAGCSLITSVTIPDSVTSISDYAFYDCSGLTSITIGSGVTSIGYHAFWNCSNLTSIIIPDGAISIGEGAFRNCSNLTSIIIPNSVTSIGPVAFWNCSNLTSITIPNSVTIIDSGAFSGCSSLTSVTIPNSVTIIDNGAFYNCSGLTSITIPDGVTGVGTAAFQGCSNLTYFKFEGNVIPDYSNVFKDTTPLLKRVYVNADATGWGTTWNDKPVYVLGADVFSFELNSGNDSYTVSAKPSTTLTGNIAIPSTYNKLPVTNIAARGFEPQTKIDTKTLTGIEIPDSVVSIGYNAFKNCVALTSVEFPKTLSKLGLSAFENCSSLTSVVFDSAAPITDIEHYTFKNCSELASVVLPDSVTGIGNFAFYSCSKLAEINIPSKVTSIGDSAFSDCLLLKSVTIPATAKYIGNNAFYNCRSLNRFKLEGNFIPENRKVLTNTISLTSVSVNAEKTSWSKEWNGKPLELEYSDYLTYTLNSDKASYSVRAASNKKLPNTIEIPATYKGLPVTAIANNAFYYCSAVTSISIPNSITTIEPNAFIYCTELVSVNIPDSVTNIKSQAFNGCSKLTSITIPSSVTFIGDWAFASSGLTEITIPETVTTLESDGEGLFYGCSALTTVVLPNTLTKLGWYFFKDCTNLTTVNIPDSITKIGKQAFYRCSELTLDALPSSLTTIEDEAFATDSYDMYTFSKLIIPDKVTKIGAKAFYGCVEMYRVIIPSSVTEIGDEAFYTFGHGVDIDEHKPVFYLKGNFIPEATKVFGNANLDYVIVNKGTTGWGDTWNGLEVKVFDSANPIEYTYAPNDPQQLTTASAIYPIISGAITIPSTYDGGPVKYIGDFKDCDELTKVTLPNSITSISSAAFKGCSKLASINLPSTAVIAEEAFSGCSSLTSISIPTSNTIINKYAFNDCSSLKTISIPSSITEIGYGAFSGCSSLTSVTIPNTVTTINHWAFSSCTSLATVSIGSGVTKIGNSAFYYTAISSITIPKSVELIGGLTQYDDIGGEVFGRCNNLKTITVNTSNSVYRSEGNCIINRSTNELLCGCKASVIPSTVKSIGKRAFYFCENLTSITIPSSVTNIKAQAFRGCSSLTSITIPSSVTTINSDNVFTKCTNLSYFKFEGNYITYTAKSDVFKDTPNLKYLFIKPGTTGWGSTWEYKSIYYDWNDCLTFTLNSEGTAYSVKGDETIDTSGGTILIPETYNSLPVTSIGSFSYNRFTSIVIPNSITSISASAFYSCVNLTSIDIPDSVTTIGNKAFYGCVNLSSIKLSNSLDTIAESTFSLCSSLTSITIPDSVVYVNADAFNNCSALSSVEIGKSVTNIGPYAFSNCGNLTSVVIPEATPYFGNNVFNTCSNLISLEFEGDKPSSFGNCIDGCDKFEYFIAKVGTTGWGDTFVDKPVRYKSGGYGAIQNVSLTNSLVQGNTSIMRTYLGESVIQP